MLICFVQLADTQTYHPNDGTHGIGDEPCGAFLYGGDNRVSGILGILGTNVSDVELFRDFAHDVDAVGG